eukprot:1689353-Lingulodinium_polyedra.AAC.1
MCGRPAHKPACNCIRGPAAIFQICRAQWALVNDVSDIPVHRFCWMPTICCLGIRVSDDARCITIAKAVALSLALA